MLMTLPQLPYPYAALEPYISTKTLEVHHEKHHAGYVEKINGLIKATAFENEQLETIMQKTVNDTLRAAVFNNAAQVWNHSFYWQCMKPKGGGPAYGAIADRLKKDVGGYDVFVEQFKKAAISQFGSGWAWLVLKENRLSIMTTSNADSPVAHGVKPLLTVDVWEHAYYLDYQNKRGDYIDVYINNLINWDFVNSLLV
jgi:Fe-Mn family superoxide dismutase